MGARLLTLFCLLALGAWGKLGDDSRKLADTTTLQFNQRSDRAGVVEIVRNGVAGTICNIGFTSTSANVICKLMGFPGQESYTTTSAATTSKVWISNLACSGSETNIAQCSSSAYGSPSASCTSSKTVVVTCQRKVKLIQSDSFSQEVGTVQVYHDGEWGTVCDNAWDTNDGAIACHQAGFADVLSVKANAFYGQGSGKVWLGNTGCNSANIYLESCSHSSWGSTGCGHSDDAGVECSPHSLKLVGGPTPNEGWLGIHLDLDDEFGSGQYRGVRASSFSYESAARACGDMGFAGVQQKTTKSGTTTFVDTQTFTYPSCSTTSRSFFDCLPNLSYGSSYTPVYLVCSYETTVVAPAAGDVVKCDNAITVSWIGLPGYGTYIQANLVDATSGAVLVSGYNRQTNDLTQTSLITPSCSSISNRDVQVQVRGGYQSYSYAPIAYSGTFFVRDNGPDARLVGNDPAYGRLEVRTSTGKTWGTVCSSNFGTNDANVACKQIGLLPSISVFKDYGGGSGDIMMTDLACSGAESTLSSCSYSSSTSGCSHENDVGLRCGTFSISSPAANTYLSCSTTTVITWTKGTSTPQYVSLYVQSLDGTNVKSYTSIYNDGSYSVSLGCTLLTTTYETGMMTLSIQLSGGGYIGNSGAFTYYSGYPIRLVGGTTANSGRVEISKTGSTWGTVCGRVWTTADGLVACKNLGYTGVTRVMPNFGGGDGLTIYMDNVQCSGTEKSLSACQYNGWSNVNAECNHNMDVGVECSGQKAGEPADGTLRLKDGSSRKSGRLEIFHGGEWGSVCSTGFSQTDANVVCKQLGFESALSFQSNFGGGSDKIWLKNAKCSGTESRFESCTNDGWGSTSGCTHVNDVGVTCFATDTVRLISDSPFRGIVQVLHNNKWGYICDSSTSWDGNSASVVCKQLGFSRGGSTCGSKTWSGPFFMDKVTCTYGVFLGCANVWSSGSELSIQTCAFSGWGSIGSFCDRWDYSCASCYQDFTISWPGQANPPYQFMCGNPIKIQWSSYNVGTSASLKIHLFQGDEDLGQIASTSNSPSYYAWTPPCKYALQAWDQQYRFKIISGDKSGWGELFGIRETSGNIRIWPYSASDPYYGTIQGLTMYSSSTYSYYTWGRLCTTSSSTYATSTQVTFATAEIACSQIGYGHAEQLFTGIYRSSSSGGTSSSWRSGVSCKGNELSISACPYSTSTSCSSSKQVDVRCRPNDIDITAPLKGDSVLCYKPVNITWTTRKAGQAVSVSLQYIENTASMTMTTIRGIGSSSDGWITWTPKCQTVYTGYVYRLKLSGGGDVGYSDLFQMDKVSVAGLVRLGPETAKGNYLLVRAYSSVSQSWGRGCGTAGTTAYNQASVACKQAGYSSMTNYYLQDADPSLSGGRIYLGTCTGGESNVQLCSTFGTDCAGKPKDLFAQCSYNGQDFLTAWNYPSNSSNSLSCGVSQTVSWTRGTQSANKLAMRVMKDDFAQSGLSAEGKLVERTLALGISNYGSSSTVIPCRDLKVPAGTSNSSFASSVTPFKMMMQDSGTSAVAVQPFNLKIPDCSGHKSMPGPYGDISDGSSASYAANMLCKWTILSPRGRRVRFNVSGLIRDRGNFAPQMTSANFLKSSSCTNAQNDSYVSDAAAPHGLSIYDGNSTLAPRLKLFCGTETGFVISTQQAMHLVFASDSSAGGNGFFGTYIMEVDPGPPPSLVWLWVLLCIAGVILCIVMCCCCARMKSKREERQRARRREDRARERARDQARQQEERSRVQAEMRAMQQQQAYGSTPPDIDERFRQQAQRQPAQAIPAVPSVPNQQSPQPAVPVQPRPMMPMMPTFPINQPSNPMVPNKVDEPLVPSKTAAPMASAPDMDSLLLKRTDNQEMIRIEYNPSWTVPQLKEELHRRCGVIPDKQRLVSNRRQLSSPMGETLGDLGVSPKEMIVFVVLP